jgi:hypothetical protein
MLNAASIASLLRQEVKPVFLLGAGASYKSGIPLAADLVDQIAKWGFCRSEGRTFDDVTVMRSDYLRWLERETWYRADISHSDLFPLAVERVLRPREARRAFFQQVLKPRVPASSGYQCLARLMARGALRTILTTNFDSLIAQTAAELPQIYQIDEIKTEDDQKLFTLSPTYPQIIYLHGSIDHYTDGNTETETQRLNQSLVELLRPLLRDHPLVVVGYRGAEPSVMRHLLIEQANACADFRNGIYWCCRPVQGDFVLPPLVKELDGIANGNLQFVEIAGFDELMAELDVLVPATEAASTLIRQTISTEQSARACHDLQPAEVGLDSLSVSLIRAKLIAYYEAQRLTKPQLDTTEHLLSAMAVRSLATSDDTSPRPTRGSQLLFAKDEQNQISSAVIEVTVNGPKSWVAYILDQPTTTANDLVQERILLDGNLWTQLERASDLLSRVNRPFRLKGASSVDVTPYPPLALKELITNLIAHRDYAANSSSSLVIAPESLTFENPGGLVDAVQRQLDNEQIQAVIDVGTRRVKGYRNPVIADFFFFAGAMDKEGSGLPDVVQEANNNLNEVTFGPTINNDGFVATIKCRPEALNIDDATRTAKPSTGELRYSPNLLKILAWPAEVTRLGTVETYKTLQKAYASGAPPFFERRGWIYTFEHPAHPSMKALLDLAVSEEQYRVSSSEIFENTEVGSGLPGLLNSAVAKHLERAGLRVKFEGGTIRAYFPSLDGAPREITYKGQFKQATRTVTKPIRSRSTGAVVFWEHKSVSLKFERFGATWTLSMLPSYVFTRDGDTAPVDSEKIGALTTRRASRDYNPSVMHDLVFWSRILSGGSGSPTFRLPVVASNNDADFNEENSVEIAAIVPTMVFRESVDASMSALVDLNSTEADLARLQEEMAEILDEATNEEEDAETPNR